MESVIGCLIEVGIIVLLVLIAMFVANAIMEALGVPIPPKIVKLVWALVAAVVALWFLQCLLPILHTRMLR